MDLSHELLSQFAKLVTKDKKTNAETTVYGTIVVDGNGNKYVKLDGSDQLTPLSNEERPVADSATANANEGERVSVLIKNHTATVTGNVSSPAARTGDVENLGTHVSEFDILISHQVTADDLNVLRAHINELLAITGQFDELSAITAEFEELKSEFGKFDKITADDIKAISAKIDDLKAQTISVDILDTNMLSAFSAEIDELKAYTASFTYISAVRADIDTLNANTLSTKEAEIKYANIDFANIGEAAIRKIFSESGLIHDLVVGDGTITGELVGVTIKGDLIEGNTVTADKLVVKGSDGLYYKLNFEGGNFAGGEQIPTDSLHGSIITAKSVTAEKVSVHDLVAFGATIGGFNITNSSLYSGVKSDINNTTRGIYLDNEGQMAVGDGSNFIRYYKTTDDQYRLEIITGGKSVDEVITETDDELRTVKSELAEQKKHIEFSDNGIRLSAGNNSMSLRIDNDIIVFEKNGVQFGWWDGNDFHTGNIAIEVTERAQFGNFAMVPRSDGSLSFLKVQDNAGFYTICSGGILFLYGTYPTVNDTTMILNDVSIQLDGTTLTLGGQ